jgi:hypothetical protein
MPKIDTERAITDEYLHRALSGPFPSALDRFFDVFLYFRLGQRAKTGPKCLYLKYSCVSDTSAALGTIMDVAEVDEMKKSTKAKRLCFISDTHEKHHVLNIPKCDVLVHMGDILFCGRKQSLSIQLHKLKLFGQWLESQQQAKHRLLVGGNHDMVLENLSEKQLEAVLPTTTVLHNKRATIEGLNFYGSPFSSGLSKNRAFQGDTWRDKLIEDTRNRDDIDVLITHGDDVKPLDYNINAKIHAFGHHHSKRGVNWLSGDQGGQRVDGEGVLSVCATIMDEKYRPSNLPIVVDLEPGPLTIRH